MRTEYWREVVGRGLAVPADRPLDDLTAELTVMLGSPDAEQRDGIALPALSTWISQGVYDDLLPALGDGMAAGLRSGLGEQGTDTVFRRSFSALALTECLARGNSQRLISQDVVMRWGDHVASWLVRERDTRGWVPGKGWAHSIAHGADALGQLAESAHFTSPELTVLLDVIADRLLDPTAGPLLSGEPDRLAAATRQILGRGMIPFSVVEPWLVRVASGADVRNVHGDHDPYHVTATAQGFLRSLYLQLELGQPQVPQRADLLLSMIEALSATNWFLSPRH